MIVFKMSKHSDFHLIIFQTEGAWQDLTVVTKLIRHFKSSFGFGGHFLKIRDVCMDFEPYFKVHNLVSVYPKSVILGQMTNLNTIFHMVVSVYWLVKIWNSPQSPDEFWNGQLEKCIMATLPVYVKYQFKLYPFLSLYSTILYWQSGDSFGMIWNRLRDLTSDSSWSECNSIASQIKHTNPTKSHFSRSGLLVPHTDTRITTILAIMYYCCTICHFPTTTRLSPFKVEERFGNTGERFSSE